MQTITPTFYLDTFEYHPASLSPEAGGDIYLIQLDLLYSDFGDATVSVPSGIWPQLGLIQSGGAEEEPQDQRETTSGLHTEAGRYCAVGYCITEAGK